MFVFPPQRDAVAPSVEQVRGIALALMIGPLMFGAVLALLYSQEMLPLADAAIPSLDVGVVVLAATLLLVAFAVRGHVWGRARAGADPEQKRLAYARGVLLFYALTEGGILLALVAVLLSPTVPWPAVGAAVFLWLVQLAVLPGEMQYADVTG